MSLYCGIDLHSNNHVVVIIDDEDRRLVEKRLPNNLQATLDLLAPFRGRLVSVAVESTFNWYWLVDGLMEAGFEVKLANTTAIRQYEGLKHTTPSSSPTYCAWVSCPPVIFIPKSVAGFVISCEGACNSCGPRPGN